MPFRDDQSHLRDILESITNIAAFVAGMSFKEYEDDTKTRSAVERQFQILSEAAIRLGNEAESLCPGIDWRGVRGMGNFLRHDYQSVDNQIIWNTIVDDIPRLKDVVEKALK